jgi:hypothetical protein
MRPAYLLKPATMPPRPHLHNLPSPSQSLRRNRIVSRCLANRLNVQESLFPFSTSTPKPLKLRPKPTTRYKKAHGTLLSVAEKKAHDAKVNAAVPLQLEGMSPEQEYELRVLGYDTETARWIFEDVTRAMSYGWSMRAIIRHLNDTSKCRGFGSVLLTRKRIWISSVASS